MLLLLVELILLLAPFNVLIMRLRVVLPTFFLEEVLHFRDVILNQHETSFLGSSVLLEKIHHLLVSHVVRPMPSCVPGVIAGIDLGSVLQEQVCTLNPSFVGGVVQRGVSSGFNLVHINTIIDGVEDGCPSVVDEVSLCII